MNKLIKKVAQKVAVDYCNLSIVENPDGFLTQDAVCRLLNQECGIQVISGNNLQLRIHYELHYKDNPQNKFVYICKSGESIQPDMKQSAFVTEFSISDVFPLFADKTLLRKQSFEVLDCVYEQAGIRKVTMQEGGQLIRTIVTDIENRKRKSAEFLLAQLTDVELDWNMPATTIQQVSRIISEAVKEGVYEGIAMCVDAINESFQQWVDKEYFATLQSNPLKRAKSVNKILPHIEANHAKDDKIALLVVDGFAYWQYTILKEFLKQVRFTIEDGCTLAWLPSITMLSRQAIFRGSDPLQDYKQSPENEKKLWMEYWQKQGFYQFEIQYIYDTDEFTINEGVKRLAVVTVEMDEKMHSSTDYKDLYSLTENWCSRIIEQVGTIINSGYTIYLTTDHGSVLSQGWRPLTQIEKVFLYKDGSRGMRHLIYNNRDEQERFYKENSDLSMIMHDNWMSIRNDSCFAKENKSVITHGGSHFMEMIVPFIKIKK
ncbi:MAG: PglZ domain-containing protein [Bacteroidaceae bacterium]|nr:PglZ domain-containing protein [Bacteroidaceae bacterium]